MAKRERKTTCIQSVCDSPTVEWIQACLETVNDLLDDADFWRSEGMWCCGLIPKQVRKLRRLRNRYEKGRKE